MPRKPQPAAPDLRAPWQIEQGARCGCHGVDDMCPCQNVDRNAPTPITAPEVCGLDLGKLEEVARAATPGPWRRQDHTGPYRFEKPEEWLGYAWIGHGGEADGRFMASVAEMDRRKDASKPWREQASADALHIATFDPPTVLRLISDLRAANTALLREQLRASVLLEMMKTALARVDAANAACPVRSSAKSPDRCPRCGADDRQNCGPNVSALDGLEAAAREALAAVEAA